MVCKNSDARKLLKNLNFLRAHDVKFIVDQDSFMGAFISDVCSNLGEGAMLVCKIPLLARRTRPMHYAAGRPSAARDDRVSCIQEPCWL